MENEFVSYEIALALKELGFEEPCIGFYTQNAYGSTPDQEVQYWSNPIGGNDDYVFVLAPLYQQAFRWFREKYNIDINIQKDSIGIYHFNIKTNKYGDWREPIFNSNYKEAELECIEKLIEIVKS